jgi:hypothetical protein
MHRSSLAGGEVSERAGPNFFISYTSADATWATWIATELEKAGHTTVSQARDFRAGHDFVHEMHHAVASAERTIAVLSPAYLASEFGEAEWRAAFVDDPSGERGKLVPVKVQPCQPPGLLRARVHIDLVGVDTDTARRRLLDGVGRAGRPGRTTSSGPVPFPGTSEPRAMTARRGTSRRSTQRVVAGLTAVVVLLIAVATGTAWALSSAPSLPGRPSAAGDPASVATPTEVVAVATEPAPPGDSPDVVSGGSPAVAPGAGRPVDGPPSEVLPPPVTIAPLKITTDSLPAITLDEEWSVEFRASGGVGPYTWSITRGAVPKGLVLQPKGRLAGAATAPGLSAFTIAVEDARGERATGRFELSLTPPPDPPVGDFDGDGDVDCTDLNTLRSRWNQTGSDLREDLNEDDIVDLTDMSILLSNWTDGDSSNC